jgi:dTDP-4-amino-4,6-dideoxygalactose transaminase
MSKGFLPYGRQTIEDDDIDAVREALRADFLTTGPLVERFETAFVEKTGGTHGVACNSGTAALHLAALAVDLKPGEAAVVPAITFLATANVVRMTGAEVVFADVDPDTGLLTAETLRVTPRDATHRGRVSCSWCSPDRRSAALCSSLLFHAPCEGDHDRGRRHCHHP